MISRRRWSSYGGSAAGDIGGLGKVVVVAVKPARDKIPTTALLWALSNVVQPGDSINLFIILPDLHSLGKKIRAFTRFRGECSTSHNKFDQRDEISDLCSKMMNQLRTAYDFDKMRFSVKVVCESTTGSVAAEAKNIDPNWVILDKHLKHEMKCCLEKLDCNLVIMKKKSRPKVLRLNLNGSSFKLQEPPQVSFPWPLAGVDDEPPPPTYFDCRDDINNSLRAPSVTPSSTPDHEFSLTTTSGTRSSSISSSEPGASPFGFMRKNHLFIADDQGRIHDGRIYDDQLSQYESEVQSFNSCIDASSRKSVREAISLPRNVPHHGSPALCTVCQHKAPGFGNPPKWFTYEELEAATEGFSEENFLAEGGFGSVYRGTLPDGQAVAVKQHKSVSSQGDMEFCSEVEVLSCAQHRNVVMLIGFCVENERRLLVYEYVCNGSLDSHLFALDRDALTWHARQRIAVGAARGLRYLHEECRVGCIVHRDMRPNNILLTHDFEPLVGDFGLARWQPHADLGVSTRIIGTFGYFAPEYVQSGQITEKADVYAFGVVLLELITGRKAIDVRKPKGQQCLTEWARPLLEKKRIDELVDPRLSKRYLVVQQLSNMMLCASMCLSRDPDQRPRMSQVLRILEGDWLMNSPNQNQTT